MEDEIAALDFDLACTLRLEIYDAEVRRADAKRIAYEVSKLFSGGEEQAGDNPAVW